MSSGILIFVWSFHLKISDFVIIYENYGTFISFLSLLAALILRNMTVKSHLRINKIAFIINLVIILIYLRFFRKGKTAVLTSTAHGVNTKQDLGILLENFG